MNTVAVNDYGMGNVGSVLNALAYLKASALVTRDAEEIRCASHIILPGVGAFGGGYAQSSKTWTYSDS